MIADDAARNAEADRVFLATVWVVFEPGAGRSPGNGLAGAVADALMALDEVVTVRVRGDAGTSVFRADVPAASRSAAAAAAAELARRAAAAAGATATVREVLAMSDAERLRAVALARSRGASAP